MVRAVVVGARLSFIGISSLQLVQIHFEAIETFVPSACLLGDPFACDPEPLDCERAADGAAAFRSGDECGVLENVEVFDDGL
jgi:hypothetical protein